MIFLLIGKNDVYLVPQLISYNCSQQVNISSSQIQVTPNYNNSECDTINSQTINQQGSLGVSLTSSIGNKCNGGKNLGVIIGLSVGIPCAAIAVGLVIAYALRKRNDSFDSKLRNLGNEMDTVGKQGWQENKNAGTQGTVWTDNRSDNV